MAVPLDMRNDIRSMDAGGVPRAEIARRLHVSRNTVAKYADMEDMSPVPPLPAERGRPALEGHEEWIGSVLEADLGAPRKQRHTAKRVFDRLVAERGYEGSYSTVRRFVADWRRSQAAGGGEGYLELEWAPGACQVDFGNFRAAVAGEDLDLKLLVLTLPHSNERQCVALRSETAECLCAGLAEVFSRWGRAPRVMVLDNATEAGRRPRGTIVQSRLSSQFRGHYRLEARFRDPYSGNEKGPVENAVGFLRRNLLAPARRPLRRREVGRGRGGQVRLREGRRARVRGGPHWHGGELLAGVRPSTVEVLADRGRRVAVLPCAFGEGPAERDPMSPLPALVARPRAFSESTIGRDVPEALVAGIDRMDGAGRRQALRAIGRAGAASGFEAARLAAERVVEGGRAPDDATVDVPFGRIAAGSGERGGADLSVDDGFLKGAVDDGRRRGPRPQGGRVGRVVLAHDCGAGGVVGARHAEAGGAPGRPPRSGEGEQGGLRARHAAAALRAARAEDAGRVRPGGGLVARGARAGGPDLAAVPRAPRGPRADGGRRHGQDAHGLGAAHAGLRAEAGGALLHRLLARHPAAARPRRGAPRPPPPRTSAAGLLVIDGLGFLPLDPDGARLLFQVFADAYERQSVVITTNLEFSRWGAVFGDDQMAAAVIDRIVHRGRLVQFRGESYRARNALVQEGWAHKKGARDRCANCSNPDDHSAQKLLAKHKEPEPAHVGLGVDGGDAEHAAHPVWADSDGGDDRGGLHPAVPFSSSFTPTFPT